MVAIIDGAKEEKDRIVGEHMWFGQDAHGGVGPDDAWREAGENGDRHAELWQQGEHSSPIPPLAAKFAYQLADAMLKARGAKP